MGGLIYNGILRGPISVLDLDYVDEIPLIFAVATGVFGIIWSLQWPEIIGLAGWGLILIVVTESVFKSRHNDDGG
jgi:hypothetical protein